MEVVLELVLGKWLELVRVRVRSINRIRFEIGIKLV